VEAAYLEFYQEFETSVDEPSRVCAIYVKEVESYMRCLKGTKKENFWIMEQEGVDWLGAYKLNGKSNYVTENLRRIEFTCATDVTDWENETIRCNCFFNLREGGGHALSLDELNELLNYWNKGCVTAPNSKTVCEKSKFIMLLKKCAYGAFGKWYDRSSIAKTKQEESVEKMVELFQRANIFSLEVDVEQEMVSSFFWDFVSLPKNVGTKKDKDFENPELSAAKKIVFSRLCTTEEEYEFEDFELTQNDEDNDLFSNASSTHGSIRSSNSMIGDNQDDVAGWEDWNEEERNVRHSESLKQLGNVAKKPMSALILKDMIGVNGDLALKDIKKIREKTLAKEKQRLDTI